jgi:NAD(P)-dependent dehydrogenase (short-subunit alcohol dehydrogenase family)
MENFDGARVLVTGGNSGIGKAAARLFVEQGARVIFTGREQASIDATVAALGPTAIGVRSDAASIADIEALAVTVAEQFGSLDVVFINAGVARFAPIEAVDAEMFDSSFAINVKGPYFLLQKLSPLLASGASVVLNGSINAHMGMPGSSVYAATKAALISMARTFSGEWVSRGIRVNVVSPGPVSTPIYGRLGLPPEDLQATAASLQAQIPLARFGEADEIAKIVAFLASPGSSFMVGSEVTADGGMIAI